MERDWEHHRGALSEITLHLLFNNPLINAHAVMAYELPTNRSGTTTLRQWNYSYCLNYDFFDSCDYAD